ncbi:calcium-activated potassium channel subunit beta-4-like [Liolophura sinensis]|uniref:calcium-activated potassium channel subunit beta-4-like n=1 Tax=Liolophura sinensis TaxID=3198878 RepID=UPI0031580DD9
MGTKAKIFLGLAVGFTVLCVVLLIALGVVIVHPYEYTRDFEQVKCTGITVQEHGYLECSCSTKTATCWSVFPCKEITVQYLPLGGPERQSILFKDYDALYDDRPCSLVPCDPSPKTNEVSVEWFAKRHTGSSSFDCYVNPTATHEVILELPDALAVTMAMVWPSIGFVIGLVTICLIMNRSKVLHITD